MKFRTINDATSEPDQKHEEKPMVEEETLGRRERVHYHVPLSQCTSAGKRLCHSYFDFLAPVLHPRHMLER